jgi:hypothetical protein
VYWRRPLTRLEAALYVAIAGVLAVVLLDRLIENFELAERAAVEATVMQVNSALNARVAYELLRGRVPDDGQWQRRNPFALAGTSPANYGGEADRVEPSGIAAGEWFYDRSEAVLLYRPRFSRHLVIQDGSRVLRFHLRATGESGARAYQVVPATPYDWGTF